MNIFKVLASRKKFPEEMASVFLGWLMHPEMEHGIGRLFLERFINEVVKNIDSNILHQLNATANDKIKCSLEENVTTAFIDIVYFFGDYIFAIENKIYDGSIEENQLQREFHGLRHKYPDNKIIMVYLVPDKSLGADTEYSSLVKIVESPHICALVTWADTVCNIINGILTDEGANIINPISISSKNILKSLCTFVRDGFYGYNFIAPRDGSNTYYGREYQGREIYAIICQSYNVEQYIGKQNIEAKLLGWSINKINVESFWLNDKPSSKESSWITGEKFKQIYENKLTEETP